MLRLSSQTHRLLLVAMAFLFALTLSLFGIRAALAAHYVSLNTRAGFETAVRLEPNDPQMWHSLGRYWQYDPVEGDTGRA
jgi:hypothetical protein